MKSRTPIFLVPFCLCALPAQATLSPTLNVLGRTIHVETATSGNTISLADLQAVITTRGDLTTAAVLTGEATDGTSSTIIATELANGGTPALFTFAGPNRYSRNDAAVALAATSGGRFGLIADTNTWTVGSSLPGGVTHFGTVFYNYLSTGAANLVRVTATFSDATTEVYTATATALQYSFVGFAAPPGKTITTIKVDETTGGGWLGFDDVAIVISIPTGPVATWNGDGGDNFWSNSANWESDSVPAAGDLLSFSAAPDPVLQNDLAAGQSFGGIRFDAAAPAFTLDGNAISPGPTIFNSSSQAQTVLLPLSLDVPLETNCSSGAIYLDGIVSGSGAITKEGGAQLLLSGANTFTGGMIVNRGNVQIEGDQTAADGGYILGNTFNTNLTVTSGSTAAVAAGKEVRVGPAGPVGFGVATFSVEGSLANQGALNALRGSVVNIGGTLDQSGPARVEGVGGYGATVNILPGGQFLYSGTSAIVLRSGTNDAGRGRINVAGGLLSTAQAFDYDSPGSTFTGRLTLSDGGTLRLAAPVATLADDIEILAGSGGGSIDTNGHDAGIPAVISGSGPLAKTGTGTLTLSGTNTHAGTLTVSAGTLATNGPAVLADDSALEVAAGALIHLGFTGSDVITSLKLGEDLLEPGTYDQDSHPLFISGDGALVVPNPDPFLDWIASFPSITLPADMEKSANPDGDARNNLLEFGLDGNPASGAAEGKVVSAVEGGYFTLTLPVLDGADFTGAGPLTAAVGNYLYRIDGSTDLAGFTAGVEEIAPLGAGLPSLTAGYSYRSFRLTTPTASGAEGFLRVDFSEVAP